MSTRDNAGVLAPPPLIALATLLLGLALDRIFPVGAAGAILSGTTRYVVAGIFAGVGAAVALRALLEFRNAGTPPEPWKPTSALVTTGVFGRTRNPMYQAFALLLLACAIAFASDWTVLLLFPWAIVMHFTVVLREERYLAAKFGHDYRRYMADVPRYGWPF